LADSGASGYLVGSASTLTAAQVTATDWARFDSANPVEAEHAFNLLVQAMTEADAQAAYDAVLDVLAHNHSGQIRTCAVPAAPILAKIAASFAGLPRRAALAILVDLVSWSTAGSTDSAQIGQALRSAAGSLAPLLDELAAGRQNKATPRLARDLLKVLNA
jgi:hypothetical protein